MLERDEDGGIVVLRLRGWKTLAALGLVLALIIGFEVARPNPADARTTEQILSQLKMDYLRPRAEAMVAKHAAGTLTAAESSTLGRLPEITIEAIHARGFGDEIVARVEYRIDGHAPPDGESPRYYLLQYSMLDGWSVSFQVSAARYYMALI